MARFIESQSPLNSAIKGLTQGVDEGLPYLMERLGERQKSKAAAQSRSAEDEALKKAGIDTSGIQDPKIREHMVQQYLKRKEKMDLLKSLGIITGEEGGMEGGEGMPGEEGGLPGMQQGGGQFSPENLTDEQIAGLTLINPQLGTALQRQKETRDKINFRNQEAERKPIEKSVEGFFTKLQEDEDKLPALEMSLDAMLQAVNSGDVDPFSQAHLAEIATAFGAPEAITRIFQTPGSKEFNTARKTFLSNTLKEAFRGATTGKEIELAESLLAQLGVRPEANQAALFLLQSDVLVRQEKQRLAAEAREQGLSNYKIPEYVNKRLQPFRKQLAKEYLEAVKELSKRK